jgi:hypothetical protein
MGQNQIYITINDNKIVDVSVRQDFRDIIGSQNELVGMVEIVVKSSIRLDQS